MDDGSDIYRRVVEATTDGLWMFDASGHDHLRATGGWPRSWASRRGQMVGFSAFDGLDEVGQEQLREHLAELEAAPDDDEGQENLEARLCDRTVRRSGRS